jgi:hypothetical protein
MSDEAATAIHHRYFDCAGLHTGDTFDPDDADLSGYDEVAQTPSVSCPLCRKDQGYTANDVDNIGQQAAAAIFARTFNGRP